MKNKQKKYHNILLEIIDEFKKPKERRLISKNEIFNGLKANFKPHGKELKIQFDNNVLINNNQVLDVGRYHKNIQIHFCDLIYNLESVFLGNYAPPVFTSSA